jgi:hypothetical protein
MKHEKQYVFIEEMVKTEEDVDKEGDQRQVMKKPTKAKTVTWVLQGATKAMSMVKAKTAKAMPRVTPTHNK